VYAKILTGGLLPLSATLASKSVFDAFLSPNKADALLHGHSYTANPIGCAVALRALRMIGEAERNDAWAAPRKDWGLQDSTDNGGRWSFWSRDFLSAVSTAKGVHGAMAMGTVLAIELEDNNAGESSRTLKPHLSSPQAVLLIHLTDYASHSAQALLDRLRAHPVTDPHGSAPPFRIHSRPLGNVAYVMTSLFTPAATVRAMEDVILAQLTSK
jgi:dethiobiotin synthetase/adenosylmethionine--8-amino-7-oxononanoate aminotransferase